MNPDTGRGNGAGPRLPAEWEPQQAALLTWPHGNGDWGDTLAQVERTFMRMAEAIALHQRLIIACQDEATATRLRAHFRQRRSVSVHVVPSDDIWVRDHGPITVLGPDNHPRLLDFRFNGWGGKYPAARDDALTAGLHALGAFAGLPVERIDVILEGGSIDSNGAGALLTTSRCLLTQTRNPGVDRVWWESGFRDWFGVELVHWLDHGELVGDDTDGHVDMLARFVARDTIVYTACDDPGDVHHAPLGRMADELARLRQADGSPYRLIPLPWPHARYSDNGERLPLSYANFLPINGAVLVPEYAQDTDREACTLLASLFPDRRIIPIPALPLVTQHGSVHCATQQIADAQHLQTRRAPC